ncbi:hypothetical protein ACOSQ2_031041 [Xanthoceras sorbifolium]
MGGRLGGNIQGTITYNGQSFSKSIKRNIGFVTQHNVFYPHLTVTENLAFTALLRLPNTLTIEEKIMHAEEVITQLGLTKCKNNTVGGPNLRGVSEGERKRVSIGQKLLLNPSLLFLDEPTFGLDSTTTQRIVSFSWKVANEGGRTAVMTLHQSHASGAMDYFANIGYSPSVLTNTSDFLLDLANGVISSNDSGEEQAKVKQNLVYSYKKILDEKVKAEFREDENETLEKSKDHQQQYRKWTTTWWQQTSVLFRRDIKERRHQTFSRIKIIYVLIIAFLCGLLWAPI